MILLQYTQVHIMIWSVMTTLFTISRIIINNELA